MMMIYPMHLPGMSMIVSTRDGWDQPASWTCDPLTVAQGKHGLFGMVTALIVEDPVAQDVAPKSV